MKEELLAEEVAGEVDSFSVGLAPALDRPRRSSRFDICPTATNPLILAVLAVRLTPHSTAFVDDNFESELPIRASEAEESDRAGFLGVTLYEEVME